MAKILIVDDAAFMRMKKSAPKRAPSRITKVCK